MILSAVLEPMRGTLKGNGRIGRWCDVETLAEQEFLIPIPAYERQLLNIYRVSQPIIDKSLSDWHAMRAHL